MKNLVIAALLASASAVHLNADPSKNTNHTVYVFNVGKSDNTTTIAQQVKDI